MKQTFKKLRNTFGNKKNFAHAMILAAGLMTSCSKNEDEDKLIFSTPYRGEIIQDETGTFYQANTILLTVKENVTRSQVEDLIAPYDGAISGWIRDKDKEPDSYD